MGYNLNELIGKTPFDFMTQQEGERLKQYLLGIFAGQKPFSSFEAALLNKDGQQIIIDITVIPLFDTGEIKSVLQCNQRDVTPYKLMESVYRNALTEIEEKNKLLQELKSALNIVMRQGDDAILDIKLSLLKNLKTSVIPYLNTIQRTVSSEHISSLIDLVKKNLNQIASKLFSEENSLKGILSPTEARIASMIKEGMNTKEIARILNLSVRTITSHRYNIRKKLHINSKKANLLSCLRDIK